MKGVYTLGLGRNSLGSEGTGKLAGALGQMMGMQTLYMQNNALGPEGADKLAGALGQMTSIRTLDLGGNSLGSEGAWKLAGALGHMTGMQTLYLKGDVLGQEISELAEAPAYVRILKGGKADFSHFTLAKRRILFIGKDPKKQDEQLDAEPLSSREGLIEESDEVEIAQKLWVALTEQMLDANDEDSTFVNHSVGTTEYIF
uniref:Uncharacterized protein n=1 Tax=Cryptomonas curvata TaxID=233186 RepID=A0A7S0QRR8_9CRYP|mmetsp:Transcript_47865/g.100117  ORF Transcript_47865/g.100117 Transcript_47865/m.100117 type:complete len:201 (+) Transcript_47865:2-604(+)